MAKKHFVHSAFQNLYFFFFHLSERVETVFLPNYPSIYTFT